METSSEPPPDALRVLVDSRGDEMSPRLRAFVHLLRFWIGFGGAALVLGAMFFGIWLIYYSAIHHLPGGGLLYFLVALPTTVGAVFGARWARRAAARTIAGRITRYLDGISGSSSSAAFSLGPRRD